MRFFNGTYSNGDGWQSPAMSTTFVPGLKWRMEPANHHVAVLGASAKPGRFSHRAIRMLNDGGYRVSPVHPKLAEIDGLPVLPSLDAIGDAVHTLTLYVGPQRLAPLHDQGVRLRPGRVIFNPGTESAALQRRLDEAGIPWEEACTLIMLGNGRF